MKIVRIILPSGKVVEETKEFADRLLRSGAAVAVKGDSGTIRLRKSKRILETTP